jgi:hypothetical protein
VELHNLYDSPNIVRVIKLRKVRSADHVSRMEAMRNAYKMFVGKSEGKSNLEEELDVDGKMV